MLQSVRQWFVIYRRNIVVFVGIVLVGILCFEGGILYGQVSQAKPIVLSLPAIPSKEIVSEKQGDTIQQPMSANSASKEKTSDCLFVGSRNSNKYHLPTCAVAKRIKSENTVCFASKEEAEKRGYVAGCIQK